MVHISFVLGTIFLLFLSAFLSGAETAITGASRAHLFHLAKKGDERAKKVLQLQDDMSLSIESILVLNQLVSFIIPTISAWYSFHYLSPTQGTICTTIVALLIVVYAEICPKMIAIRFIIPFSLFVAHPIKIAIDMIRSVTKILEKCAKLSLRLIGVRINEKNTGDASDEELRGAIEMHAVGGDEEEAQKKSMLKSILDLEDVPVNQAMVHRKHLRTLNASLSIDEMAKEITNCPFSRIPLWKDNPENIIGILKVKTFFRALQLNNGDTKNIKISSLIAAPWYIPETTTLLEQLQNFKKKGEHFSLVVDEYGDLLGCITLEDILEEIVGEIVDEYDNRDMADDVKIQPDGSVLINGAMPIRDLNRQFDWNIPEKTASTIAGFIMYEVRKIPDVGQVYMLAGLKMEILRRQRNQIVMVRVTPAAPAVPDENSEKASESPEFKQED